MKEPQRGWSEQEDAALLRAADAARKSICP